MYVISTGYQYLGSVSRINFPVQNILSLNQKRETISCPSKCSLFTIYRSTESGSYSSNESLLRIFMILIVKWMFQPYLLFPSFFTLSLERYSLPGRTFACTESMLSPMYVNHPFCSGFNQCKSLYAEDKLEVKGQRPFPVRCPENARRCTSARFTLSLISINEDTLD